MARFFWIPVLAALLAAGLLPVRAEKPQEAPLPPSQPLTIRYYGHAFIYIITTTGVRVAIDPYAEDAPLSYKFPPQLPADVVLISNESPEHDGSIRLFGSPQIFASVTAIGLNNARGLLFRGIQTFPDKNDQNHGSTNASFIFKLDGIRFCHLGAIGHPLTPRQRAEIGTVDVLFLPVGNLDLSPADLKKMVQDTGAKLIIPIQYKNKFSNDLNLRTLPEFLANIPKAATRDLKGSAELIITPFDIPTQPTYYLLSPVQETEEGELPPTPSP